MKTYAPLYIFLCLVCLLSVRGVSQSVFSDIKIIQPSELKLDYVSGYGSQIIFRGNDAFIKVSHRSLPWIDPINAYDGVIYYAQLDTLTNTWTETPIYAENLNWKYYSGSGDSVLRSRDFAESFDVENKTLAVGALSDIYNFYRPNHIDFCGSVFIFSQDSEGNWKQTANIFDDPPMYGDYFGRKVILHNNTLFVYSRYNKFDDGYIGYVNIYNKNADGDWVREQLLMAQDTTKTYNFGYEMAANKDDLVIAAFGQIKDTRWYGYQSLSFYKRNPTTEKWEFEQEIIDTVLTFGNVSQFQFHQNVLLVGNSADTNRLSGGSNKYEGSIGVYNRDHSGRWVKTQKIFPDMPYPHYFGRSFYAHSNHLFVSANGHDLDENFENPIPGAGAVYIFKKDNSGNWNELIKVVAPDRDSLHSFGTISGYENKVMISAPGKANTKPGYSTFFDPFKNFRPSTFYLMQYDSIVNDFKDFILYPNPATDYVRIRLLAFPPQADLYLFDALGRLIRKQELSQENTAVFELSGLTNGIYIIKVVTEARSEALKFIKTD